MMKECKGEFLYFGSEGVLFFNDNDNDNTLLILKYNVKTSTLFIRKNY